MKQDLGFTVTSNSAQRGFTLVELITVVILLGVLSIVVVPRFVDGTGFAEYAFQKRALGILRNIQIKAMHDTRPNFCYKFNVVTGTDAEFGVSTSSYLNGQENASCANTIDLSSPAFLRTEPGEMSSEDISLTANDGPNLFSFMQFDSMGKITTSSGTCANGCSIKFIGENTARICIAGEGYMYAC